MRKIYLFLAVISALLLALYFFFGFAKKTGEAERTIEIQQQQIETQNYVIESKSKIAMRRAKAEAVSSSDNLEWLQQHRCKDCNSK